MKKPMRAVLFIVLFGLSLAARSAGPLAGKGMVIQGNQLKAMPGYVLEKAPNKRVLARPARGGVGHTLECACQGGTGNCSVGFTDDTAVCFTSDATPCSGKCAWDVKGVRSMRVAPR